MRLEVSQARGQGFVEVATHHDGQTILWPSKAFSKVKLAHPEKVFDEINGFLATLPKESQDVIWNSYREIKEILDMIADNLHIGNAIRLYVTQMYEVAPMQEFYRWLLSYGNLFIPSEINEVMGESSRHPHTDQTYLRPDYVYLATEALAIRLMVPIWGEFIDQSSDNDFKEMEAVALLDNTELKHWPAEAPVWDKLHNYVRFFSDDPSALINNLWKGLGSEEIPDFLQARAVVRRLTIVPLSDPHGHSIIANIYRYIKSNTKPQDRTTQDRVNRKRPDESGGGEDDDKISIAESYKLKRKVSDGDAVFFNIKSQDIVNLCQAVDPTVDLDKVRVCTDPELLNKIALIGNIYPHQIRLAQWVMATGGAFPPRAFSLVDHLPAIRLISCAQALMWHWGFEDLAVLMHVELLQQSDQLNLTAPKQAKSGARISSRYKEDLARLFPFIKPQRAKANDPDPENNFQNTAALAINSVTALIRSSNWSYHGSPELHRAANQPNTHRMVVIPQTIKNTITELVIKVAELNQ